jgi:hypothetical protein
MRDRAAQGLICWEAETEVVAAAAPVELANIDPATSRAIVDLKRKFAIPSLLARRTQPASDTLLTPDNK